MADALTVFARQSDLQILYSPALVENRRSPSLSGTMDPAAALTTLLSGTGLSFEMEGRMVTVGSPMADRANVLPALNVDGRIPEAPRDRVHVPRRSSAGTRTDTPIDDMPQALSVVTRQELDQRNVQDITDALAYSAGVRTIDYPGGQGAIDFFLRGFRQSSESVLVDGLRSGYNPYGIEYEPYGIERLEVLKGPSSATYGSMPPGGVVALTTKRPTESPLHQAQVQTGSHSRRQFTTDLSDRLDDAGDLRYRLTVLARRGGTQVDHTPDDRLYIAPALSWRAGPSTDVTLLASLFNFRKMGAEQSFPTSGTVLDNPNGRLSSNLFLGYPGLSAYHSRTLSLGYEVRQHLSTNWFLHQTLRYGHTRVGYVSNWALSGALDDDRYYRVALQDRPKTSDSLMVDTNLQGEAATGPLHHTPLIGLDHARYRAHETRRNGTVTNPIDVFAPIYGGPYTWDATLVSDVTDRIRQTGLYAQDQISVGNWRLNVGGRLDWSRTASEGTVSGGPPFDQTQFDRAITKRAGLAYHFDGGLTPYASIGTSFQPNTDRDALGRPFSPTRGTQVQAGLRYRPSGFQGLFTVALFRALQRDLTTADPDHPGDFTQTGAVRARGIELEARATPLDGLDLTAAYGYTDARVVSDTPDSEGGDRTGKRVASVPRHAGSLWVRRRFDAGLAAGFAAGVGLRYVGATYNAANTVRVPSYMLVDLSLDYDLGRLAPTLEGVGLTLTATNLFDRRYFSPGFYENSVFFGYRRSILGTLSYRW